MSDVKAIFQKATLYTDEVEYVLLSLPSQPMAMAAAAGILAEIGDPFGTVIVDKDEVTLIMPQEMVDTFQKRLPPGYKQSAVMRLITFDMPLDMGLTGFMALVARLLAEANIPIIPLGAFARDHLLVPAAKFEQAWRVLKTNQAGD